MNKGRTLTAPHEEPSMIKQVLMDLVRQKLFTTIYRQQLEKVAVEKLPSKEIQTLYSLETKLQIELMERGPWKIPDQLPNTYMEGLSARPWHAVAEWPALSNLVWLLEEYAGRLQQEFAMLKKGAMLILRRHCLLKDGIGLHVYLLFQRSQCTCCPSGTHSLLSLTPFVMLQH
jgi:hypothetical protein